MNLVFTTFEKRLFFSICALLGVYLILRAFWVPTLHDEASIFFVNIQHSEFLPFFSSWEAGNHILNSALTSLFCKLFGESLFVLRLASLLFFPLYCWGVYRLSMLVKTKALRWLLILVFLMNTYLIEFFAFSRGYGMSLGLFLLSLSYFLEYLKEVKAKSIFWTLFLCSMGVMANLTLVFPFAIMIGYLLLHWFVYRKDRKMNWWIISIFGFLPLIGFGGLGVLMNRLGVLYYGDKFGFWEVTIKSLLKSFFGTEAIWIQLVFGAFLLAGLTLFVFNWKKIDFKKDHVFTFFCFMLVSAVIGIFALRWLLDVNYPEDRTALYFFPLFIFVLILAFDQLSWGKYYGFISDSPRKYQYVN